jgi:predicted transcriptional regulator
LPALITLDQILRVPKDSRNRIKIQEIMETVPSFVDFNDPLSAVFESIASSPVGALPALKNNEIIGIIRYSDLCIESELSAIDEPKNKLEHKKKAA